MEFFSSMLNIFIFMEKQIIEIIAKHVGGTYEVKQKCAEEILRLFSVSGSLLIPKCKCGQNTLPYKANIEIEKCSRCGNDR